jgi:putative FmdB family regulatory protein
LPLYEYRCKKCGGRFERLSRVGQGTQGIECPECGAVEIEKESSTFASPGGSRSTGGGCSGKRFT